MLPPDAVLIHIIIAERVAVGVLWLVIGAIGSAAIARLALGKSEKGDLGWASLALIAAGLLIFQWRALAGYAPARPDPFVAIALFSFILSAVGVFYARGLKAPEGHQRAAILAHAGVLGCLMAAGLLS